jgi:hypothetical protein
LCVGDALALLCGEQTQEKSEARHDKAERHDGEAGPNPRQQRALGGEENTRIAVHGDLGYLNPAMLTPGAGRLPGEDRWRDPIALVVDS